jgi:hypothetical protein
MAIELSNHVYETLRTDEEFSLFRARREEELSTVLVITPVSPNILHLEAWPDLSTNTLFGTSSIQTGQLDL